MQADIQYLRIHVKSLDVRQKALVKVALEQYNSYMQTVMEANEAIADIVIIDMDNEAEIIDFTHYHQQYPQRPIIALSSQGYDTPNVFAVQKPIRPAALQLALHQAHRALVVSEAHPPIASASANTTAGTFKRPLPQNPMLNPMLKRLDDNWLEVLCEQSCTKLNPNDPEQWRQVEFEADDHLHSVLQQILATTPIEQAIKIETDKLWLLITPQTNRITVNLDDKALFNLCRKPLPATDVHMTLLSPRQTEIFLTAVQDNKNLQHLDAFLWKTALWAALGRVPKGTNLQTRVRLNQWPNMTRLYLFPHATRIAALWHANAYSLLDTADLLDIPPCYVFAFYTAAQTLGLIDAAKPVKLSTKQRATQPSSRVESSLYALDDIALDQEGTGHWLATMRKWLPTTRLNKTSQPVV